MSSKLNWLIQNTEPGSIVLQSWLSKNGISPQLAARYGQSNWLKKLRSGVYFRPGKEPHWQGAVYCLISQLNSPIHVAGLTSLAYQGKAHYLRLEQDSVWLEIPAKTFIPKWFKELPSTANSLFKPNETFPDWRFLTSNKLNYTEQSDLIEVEVKGLTLKVSSQELATYELLNAVPKFTSFEHAAELFQGLVNLSPKKVQSILSRSRSIKTNRLFLFLAHYYNHPWVSRLNELEINLGSGKRKVVDNGKLDKSYLITVPVKFSGGLQNELQTEV